MKYRFNTYCIQYVLALLLFIWGSSAYGQQVLCAQAEGVEVYSVDVTENDGQGTTGSTYTWSVLESAFTGTINPITSSGNQIEIDWSTIPSGTYTLIVNEANNLGCVSEQQLFIEVQDPPAVVINSPTDICEDELLNLSATLGGSASSITWSSNSDGSFSSSNSLSTIYTPSAIDIENGEVIIFATTDDPAGSAGCDAIIESVRIEIIELQKPEFAINTNYCYGDEPDELPTTSLNGISGVWSSSEIDTYTNGEATYVFEPDTNCIETIELLVDIDPCGCIFDENETIELCQGDAPYVYPDGEEVQTNQMGEFIRVILTPVEDDCDIRTTYAVRVNGPDYPNAFSPKRSNGTNDEFKVLDEICEIEEQYHLMIYNRWGEKVFETFNKAEGWNGTWPDGTEAQAGVYLWYTEYIINEMEIKREGSIQLIR